MFQKTNFTSDQIEKLKESRFFVFEMQNMLTNIRSSKQYVVGSTVVNQYKKFIDEFNKVLPGLLNEFNISDHRVDDFYTTDEYFNVDSFLTRVIRDLGILKSKIDSAEISPIIPTKDFSFVIDVSLRKIIERDYIYLSKCLNVEAWKPVIILAGGLIEALLLDKLLTDEAKARFSTKAPNEKDLKKWDLDNLIDVAVDLQIINPGVEKLSDAVRHYRNLVHPGRELTSGLKIEPQEANVAVNILEMVIRDLGKP